MSRVPHILIADDESSIRTMLETGLSSNGFEVTSATTGKEALERVKQQPFDAVLCDLCMPDAGGFDVVREMRSANPRVPIILLTDQRSVESAVEAVARGATDFIGKPFDIATVAALLRRYLSAREQAAPVVPPAKAPDASDLSRSGLVGRSAPMAIVYKLIAQAAQTDAAVLVTGESGTGKQLAARAIHAFSARRNRPFVSVNGSGLTDTLLESDLFGNTRGALTGTQAGWLEAAEGGTLFLDELASTSPAFQASLLRVLESGEAPHVGSTETRKANVRITTASSAPLRELMAAGNFRADLYYRLSVLAIHLPPLRERTGDVELLTDHFLEKLGGQGKSRLILTREARQALHAHDFPGNVRELENALMRAAALASNGLITIGCLPPDIASGAKRRAKTPGAISTQDELIADRPTMEELERRYLHLILKETGWNRRRSAAVLGLDRRTIQRLIARYKLHGTVDQQSEAGAKEPEPDERPAPRA